MAQILRKPQGVLRVKALALLAGLALLFAVGCTKIEDEPPQEAIPERPLMLFSDTTFLDFYEGPLLSWKLKTAWLERWGGEGRVFARPVFVDIYDSLGAKAAFLRSDSGELDSRMSYVRAYGHVYALTPKGASVRADSLVWNKRENKVHTESFVRVVSETGDVLQGRGFESDAKLENWQIKSNVTGIFQDAADRMKQEDDKTREQLNSSGALSSGAVALSSSSRAPNTPPPVPTTTKTLHPTLAVPGMTKQAQEQTERNRREQERLERDRQARQNKGLPHFRIPGVP